MTRDDILRLAREAGFDAHDMSDDFTCNLKNIERFAALVAAAEREACAAMVERGMGDWRLGKKVSDAIRARGDA